MPGSTPSLHITGSVKAPTPCHRTIADHLPDDPALPGVYRINVRLLLPVDRCIQVISPVGFKYDETNYHGTHTVVQATYPDGTTEEAPIEIVV